MRRNDLASVVRESGRARVSRVSANTDPPHTQGEHQPGHSHCTREGKLRQNFWVGGGEAGGPHLQSVWCVPHPRRGPSSAWAPRPPDEDLREPLVRRQGSQVSMRVKRGRVSWLSSHGRGIATQHILTSTQHTLWLPPRRRAQLLPRHPLSLLESSRLGTGRAPPNSLSPSMRTCR